MKEIYKDVLDIRRRVFAETARLAYEDADLSELEDASYRLFPGGKATIREDIFRDRAIAEEMLRMAMGMDVRDHDKFEKVTESFDKVNMNTNAYQAPLINVIKFACEACPGGYYMATDNCRKCLGRPCVQSCPVNAITIGKTRAEIDEEKCINCGRCEQNCPYNAIVPIIRPCENVCGVDAIYTDELGLAGIDHDKCVACGRCMNECPFGAIADKTQIYQLIKAIKNDKRVYAMLAPSFVGQFGALTTPAQVFEGIKELGFEDVVEVALGADFTTLHEAMEYLEEVPAKLPFMGTSCCYSWTSLVERQFPDLVEYISDSGSPMKYTAEYIKEKDPEAIITFIGPCISKKLEGIEKLSHVVDFVITFEELMGMFVAKGIEPSEIEISKEIEDSSITARGFAKAGGVAEAVVDLIQKIDPEREILIEGASSLEECVKLLRQAQAGLKDGYLLEGMACPGGCIAGPGTLVSLQRANKALKEHMENAPYADPLENKFLPEELKEKTK